MRERFDVGPRRDEQEQTLAEAGPSALSLNGFVS
jgi:hypothetical protein